MMEQLHQRHAEESFNRMMDQQRAAYYRQSNPWWRNREGRLQPQSRRLRMSPRFTEPELQRAPNPYRTPSTRYRQQQGSVGRSRREQLRKTMNKIYTKKKGNYSVS